MLYYFLLGLQGVTTLVVFLEFLYLYTQGNSHRRTILMILTQAAWINNAGYFVEILASTKEAALIGTRISYLGKSFIPFMILMLALDYCNARIPNAIRTVLAFFHAGICALVIYCEQNDLFYTSIEFQDSGAFPHLVLGHGPMYYLFLASAGVYFCISAVLLIRQYQKEENANKRRQIVGMLATMMVAVVGLLLVALRCTGGYDTTALAYAVASVMLYLGIRRYDFLDFVVEAKEYALNQLAEGIIVLDGESHILYNNQVAGRIIAQASEGSLSQQYFSVEGRVYQVERQEIRPKQGKQLFLYLLKDVTDSYHYEEQLEREVALQTKRAEERRQKMEQMSLQVVHALADTIDAKDKYTKGHSYRVAEYAVCLARELGYSEEQLSNLRHVALLHDIGKIGVPDSVLNKPDKLTQIEYEVVKSHAALGGDILQHIDTLPGVRDGARYHHERYDGQGYPDGLAGKEIPEVARIICIADAYDAMSSRRVYRDRLPDEGIRSQLEQGKGTQFDPEMTEVFLRLLQEGKIAAAVLEADVSGRVRPELMPRRETPPERNFAAGKDFLTGLCLRYDGERAIKERLQEQAGCLCLADVDGLRHVNDSRGHLEGDRFLLEVAGILREYEGGNLLCRFGGDEFILFLSGADEEGAKKTAQDILRKFGEKKKINGLMAAATLSLGMALCRSREDYESVLAKAEKALYHVKQSQKGGYHIYRKEAEAAPGENGADLEQLLKALDGGQADAGPLSGQLSRYLGGSKTHTSGLAGAALVTLDIREDVTADEQEQAMRSMERAARLHLGADDLCIRYGGVQFLVVLGQADEERIHAVMKRIVRSYLKHYHGRRIEVSYEVVDREKATS